MQTNDQKPRIYGAVRFFALLWLPNYFSPLAPQLCKCENSTRVVFSHSPGTEIYSSFDTPLGSFTGEDGVLIPP